MITGRSMAATKDMRFAALTIFSFSLASCAPTPEDPPSVRREAILGGSPDATHDDVFYLLMGTPSAHGIACTATLVAPRLLLTALHCVLDANPEDSGKPACEQRFDTPRDFKLGATATNAATAAAAQTWHAIAAVHTPPAPELATLCGRDLALVELKAPVPKVEPATPNFDLPVLGDALEVVGYGDDGLTVNQAAERRSRADSQVVKVVPPAFRVSLGPCAGDSGGPAFDEAGALVGVMSRGDKSSCANMLYEGLGPHADWLRATVAQVTKQTGDHLPTWAALRSPRADAGTPPGRRSWTRRRWRAGHDRTNRERCGIGMQCRSHPPRPFRVGCWSNCACTSSRSPHDDAPGSEPEVVLPMRAPRRFPSILTVLVAGLVPELGACSAAPYPKVSSHGAKSPTATNSRAARLRAAAKPANAASANATQSYIDAVHRVLHPQVLAYLDSLATREARDPVSDPSLMVTLALTIGHDGAIRGVAVEHESALPDFDAGLVRMLGPIRLPRAPDELLRADRTVRLVWHIYRDPTRACSQHDARIDEP